MKTVLVTFDLSRGGNRYSQFKDTLERCGKLREVMPSTFLLQTYLAPVKVMERLNYHLESRDLVFVVSVNSDFAANLPHDKLNQIRQFFA